MHAGGVGGGGGTHLFVGEAAKFRSEKGPSFITVFYLLLLCCLCRFQFSNSHSDLLKRLCVLLLSAAISMFFFLVYVHV